MDIMVPSLRAVLHLSHLVGLASPQMSNLSVRGGHVVGVLGRACACVYIHGCGCVL